MANKLIDDCFVHDKKRLRHAEALAILRTRLQPVADGERIPLVHAAGRILRESAVAVRPVPAHTNAAVDGYSFAFAEYDATAGRELTIEGRAAAGHPLPGRPKSGVAVRIFTGAVLPDGHDTVVMQEDVTHGVDGRRPHVAIPGGLKRGSNVRRAGEDLKAGECLLDPGAVLRPQDLAALASIGLSEVACFRRLAVAIISTGDEIVSVSGGELGVGGVHDANAPMLAPLIAAAGANSTYLGVLPDDSETVKRRLAEAARTFDVIVTSGGASRGEEDHVVAALDQLGKRHIWQLAIKPGRPMSFGQIGNCVMVGLPGNPVAVFVCFLLYVWPMLRRMGGAEWPEPRRYRLPALFEYLDRKVGRREFWRGTLRETSAGLGVEKFGRDGSGLISGLRAADGLIEIAEDIAAVRPGDLVAFIPFTEFGIPGR
jgi:molybdopterin molybdotransferase